MQRGDLWWANLGVPTGSVPGYTRPVLVVQSNSLNDSRWGTVICIPLTTNLKWATAPGNVLLPAEVTGLPEDSVAVAAHVTTIDRGQLTEFAGHLSHPHLEIVLDGLDVVLDRR